MLIPSTIVLLSPGQGSQTVGMLNSWLELPYANDRIMKWSAVSKIDLKLFGTNSTLEEISNTLIAQPLIVATTLLAYEELIRSNLIRDASNIVVAGHSVGEISAYAIAGIISNEDAIRLATIRGFEMAKACAIEKTGMAAILGGNGAEILKYIKLLNLSPANYNTTGQVVAAGSTSAIEFFSRNHPYKTRVSKLTTSGAFHTHYMNSALSSYSTAISEVVISEPNKILLSNLDGKPVASAEDAMKKLIAQLISPVRWDLCNKTIKNIFQYTKGPISVLELPPAGILTRIAKRELKGVSINSLNILKDLYKSIGT